MEATEEVAADGAVRYSPADGRYPVEIPPARIAALHDAEHLVTSALCRQVYMIADIAVSCHDGDGLVIHILGVRRGEAYAHVRHSFGHCCEQIGEADDPPVLFVSVGVYILPQQRYLAEILGFQIPHFVEDAFYFAASFSASCVGYDAVAAEVVAPTHDGDESVDMYATHFERHHIFIRFLCG